jgi:catechol 2,3-dioxygenase-like lactoylglutathione lyase family enzyme
MKTRIHIGLAVSDLEKSKQFYSTLFGASPTKVKPDYANWRLDQPALHLALVHAPQHATGANPVRHFGVELFKETDLHEWRVRVLQAGMEVRDEEEVVCCYAKADKFWAKDPDGNEWEFWVRLEEANAMKGDSAASGEQCCAPATAKATAGRPAMATAGAPAEAASPCCTPAQKAEAQAAKVGCC